MNRQFLGKNPVSFVECMYVCYETVISCLIFIALRRSIVYSKPIWYYSLKYKVIGTHERIRESVSKFIYIHMLINIYYSYTKGIFIARIKLYVMDKPN